MKMRERNQQLKETLTAIASKETVEEIQNVPKEDIVNRQGFAAYSLSDELRLLTMLNTLKIQNQFYRSEDETMKELRDLVERCDPYFVAQAVVYSRCMAEGMRSINHLAAALVAPYTTGLEWARRFYGVYDKKAHKNGCIFRTDDMREIKDILYALGYKGLPGAVRKGFKDAIESMDTYRLAKYKDTVIDIANLVHPNPSLCKCGNVTLPDGEEISVLSALMRGIPVTADTWETAQSEAGQEVAKAVKEGKITKEEAEKVLSEAKADNWESLLKEGKLGILAALRNIRNIMKNPRREIIDAWCTLISNKELIKKGLILPIHFDLAHDVIEKEFANMDYVHQVLKALEEAYMESVPNVASVFTGKTCIIVDCSGSMRCAVSDGNKSLATNSSWWGGKPVIPNEACSYKAGLIAATIAKATGADVIKFGSSASYFNYNQNENVFSLAKKLGTSEFGCTYPYTAFNLMVSERKKYDRIIFISDNEINSHNLTSDAYRNYLRLCSPYIYAIDLAAYGTTPLAGDKIAYFYGYGRSLYEDLTKNEFDPSAIIDKVKSIVI